MKAIKAKENKDTKRGRKGRKDKVVALIKALLLLSVLVGLPLYMGFFHRDLISRMGTLDEVVELVRSYGKQSVLIFILLEILQIVISVLPGQIFHIAAGYVFGFFPGVLYTTIGSVIGSGIAYFIAAFLGRDAIKLFASDRWIDRYLERMNSKKAYLIIFLIYLIPGIPKDIAAYAVGLSRVKCKTFLALSTAGRLPALASSVLIGALYDRGDHLAVGLISIGACLIFLLCLLKRKQILSSLDSIYDKISQ